METSRRHLPPLDAAEREHATRKWYEANKEAIDGYNELIDKAGLFSDRIRMF